MTYRSESRGIMYTAPPSGDEDDQRDETADAAETPDANREGQSLESTTGVTDANWTGTVPADD